MTPVEMLWFFVLSIPIVFLWKTLEIKQIAYRITKKRCDDEDVQLLDQGVFLKKIRVRRNASGRLAMELTFQFEFSTTGDARYLGRVVMLGRRLESFEFEAYKI